MFFIRDTSVRCPPSGNILSGLTSVPVMGRRRHSSKPIYHNHWRDPHRLGHGSARCSERFPKQIHFGGFQPLGVFLIAGIRAQQYKFRVRAVNKMGSGTWCGTYLQRCLWMYKAWTKPSKVQNRHTDC